MSTHINNDAKFAKTVLMPGDPLRAKYIAENFLVDYKEVTSVRGILGFTGHTKAGKEISVMASGNGNPSIGIYSYELYAYYGVGKYYKNWKLVADIKKNATLVMLSFQPALQVLLNFAYQFDLKGGVFITMQ